MNNKIIWSNLYFIKISDSISSQLHPYSAYGDSNIKFDYIIDIGEKTVNFFLNSNYIKNLQDKLDNLGITNVKNYLYSFDGKKSDYLDNEIIRRESLNSNNFFKDIENLLQSNTDVPLDVFSKLDKGLHDLKIKIYPKLTLDDFINCKYKKWNFPISERSLEEIIVDEFPSLKINQYTQVRIEFVWPREIGNFIVNQNEKVRNELSKTLKKSVSVLINYNICAETPNITVASLPNLQTDDYRNKTYKFVKALEKHFPNVRGINTSNDYWRISKTYLPDDKRYWSKEQLFNYFVNLSKEKYGDLYEYDIDGFIDLDNLTEVYCKQHQRWFEVFPKEHINGKRCPFDNESKGETMVRVFLEKNKIKFNQYHKLKGCFSTLNNKCILLTFDFYLPELNVTIEYDGEQHYRPIERFGGEKTYERQVILDEIKNKFCKESNIKLIRIPYTVKKQKDINDILSKELNITS